ncbi:hypothetical protein [Cryptosporangium phraense]|uniref:Uncharacterized protein n=1 Tax=Cryptosporangium phraense TaxID=2593070 RepID=A0A545AZV2_9ACTN|nr:hypothetical protein [Cryptosporangium phraense]TQS46863.1 hypothetical protein FL583_00870 [Cryptosporangium phraense]
MRADPVTRRSRRIALLFGVLGAGGFTAWHLWPTEQLYALPVWIIVIPVGLVPILVGIYMALFWSANRRPPAGLQIGHRRGTAMFLAPSTPLIRGAVFLLTTPFLAGLVTEHSFTELTTGAAKTVVCALLVLVAIGITGAHVWLFYRSAPLRLTAEGVVTPLGRRIPWDAFARDGPSSRSVEGNTVWLLVRHATPGGRPYTGPVLAARTPTYEWYPLTLDGIFIDRQFLAAALRYYAEHPDARPTIGTADSYHRLLTALTNSRVTTGNAAAHQPGASPP